MEAIPMSRVSSVSVSYEIKGHSIWEGFCKNGIMTQREKKSVEKKKRIAAHLKHGESA